jgi:hypothetical protein
MESDMKSIGYYQDLAKYMIDNDAKKIELFEGIEAMWHNKWNVPHEIVKKVRPVPSSDPHDALMAATRVLSTLEPRYKFQPYAQDPQNRERANDVENWIRWMMRGASRRSQSGIVKDVVLSALMYDEVCVQVTYIPWQKKTLETFGGNNRHLKMAQRYGPFIVQVRNPKNVHVRYSDMMPECVLFSNQTTIRAAKAYWGNLGKGLYQLDVNVDDPKEQERKIIVYDMTDWETRCVWAVDAEKVDENATVSNAIIIQPMKHELPFFPWVTRTGGTMLEDLPEYQVLPMLAGAFRTGQWETQNIANSLWMSEMIDLAGQPTGIKEGANPDSVIVDYGETGNSVKVPPGHKYTPIPKTQFDQGLVAIVDRLGSALDKSTVSRILQNADIPSGTAFSTLNLATQTAVGALKPYKALAEQALADVGILMLEWVHYSKIPAFAWGVDNDNMGKEIEIKPEEIDPEYLVLDVELTPDVPTDRASRINSAAIAMRELNYPNENALEDIGVTDPQKALRTRKYEMLQDFMMQIQMQQMMQMQAAQQMQMQQPAPGTPPGVENANGQGFNPAAGGQPAQGIAPEATFEEQTGMARNGMEIGQ